MNRPGNTGFFITHLLLHEFLKLVKLVLDILIILMYNIYTCEIKNEVEKMNEPNPITYTLQSMDHTVVLNHPKQLIVEQGYPCIDGGKVRHQGGMRRMVVRYDNKPELASRIAAWVAAWGEYKTAKAAEFARNVPGLAELRTAQDAAYNEGHRYQRQFEAMMDDEHNDGVRPPLPANEALPGKASQLADQYPRAAMYLKAETYTYADNDRKYTAGKKAMGIIAEGGSLEEAKSTLDNWLPESAMWD